MYMYMYIYKHLRVYKKCWSLASAHLWHMDSTVTLQCGSHITMWQRLLSLQMPCVPLLFCTRVLGFFVICKHGGCGFDESQGAEWALCVTANIWRALMQMLCNRTRAPASVFDRLLQRSWAVCYCWRRQPKAGERTLNVDGHGLSQPGSMPSDL